MQRHSCSSCQQLVQSTGNLSQCSLVPLECSSSLTELSHAHLQEDSGQLSGIVRSCIIYRAAQKRIARMYLQAARTALGEEMQRLRGTL